MNRQVKWLLDAGTWQHDKCLELLVS